ncbi:MAG TPA: O-methyltransferase [Chitinophagaceae bacterium]|nr:O-methyltransferase [Chitinophagaceae bacterium]
MDLIHPLVQQYAEQFTSPSDELLQQIEQQTNQHHPQAHMLSGHLQGQFLEMISYMVRPSRILEIGTFTGFSALCLLKGLVPGGQLHTIELREEDAATARENFHKAKANEKIILHLGNALDIIPALGEKWDLVFIDADKVNYKRYYELVLPAVNKNGIILADNVLFHGQVFENPMTGKNAIAIHDFNEHVRRDQRVEQVVVTIRDGLMIIRKK